MSMNRVIHGAVRRDLARLTEALDGAPDGDRERARRLEKAFGNLHQQLTVHHEGEDEHVFPWLAAEGIDAELLRAMESEHEAMAAGLAESSAAMAAYGRSGSADDAAVARASLARTTEVVERHLAHEENELEPMIASRLESPGWKAVEKKLRRQPPGVTGRFFAWVTDGMGTPERAYFRATVPPPVTYVLAHTFGRGYYREVAPVWRS
jgi:hemerythrin-like domain-containing protein